jgi:hypothetical protein
LPDGVPFIIPLELPLCIIPSGIADPGAVSGKKHGFCFTETSEESSHVKMTDFFFFGNQNDRLGS